MKPEQKDRELHVSIIGSRMQIKGHIVSTEDIRIDGFHCGDINMKSTISFPSVFEENYRNYEQVANNFLQGIRILDFKGKDYIVGEFALNEGNAPHKFLT